MLVSWRISTLACRCDSPGDSRSAYCGSYIETSRPAACVCLRLCHHPSIKHCICSLLSPRHHSPLTARPRRAFSSIASAATWEAAGVNRSHLTVTRPVRPSAPTSISCITSSPTRQPLPSSSTPRSHSSRISLCRRPPLVKVLLPVLLPFQAPHFRQLPYICLLTGDPVNPTSS